VSRPSREQQLLQEALPAYEVTGELGRGAFGVVYGARHAQLGREVAIKQLPRAFAADASVRERFVAEARMVASLDHPHIVPVYDFVDRDDGICLLIMERCQGALSDKFTDEGLATDEACAAVLACCAALDFAHGRGLLHRDIKPENLMFDAKGTVKLGDFGIARALDSEARRTATGMIIGTPAYMSPEQVRGDTLTPASDVYSVAVMTYELLTGMLPFPETSTATGLLAHHLVTEPTPLVTSKPELPAAIGAVVDRALSKDLTVRHASALAFATDLTRACVKSFGAGWLRRRRFLLHWPEMLAESERADDQSVRTGTILVKADPHRDRLIGAPATPPVTEGTPPTPPGAPLPASLLPPPPPGASRPPAAGPPPAAPHTPALASPALASPTPIPPAPISSPASAVAAPPTPTGRRGLLVGAGVAAALALVVGVVAFTGGDDGNGATNTTAPVSPVATDPTGTGTVTSTQSSPSSTAASGTGEPDPSLSTRPAGLDMTVVESPWTPTPCPEDQPRVACLFAGVSVDESTGEITAPYFTQGFTPELEPAGYHLHFFLDTAVDGDENKAGSGAPGGAWKPWDGPSPFTSFGGENGRTGFTINDVQAANARNLCVVVADADQVAVPGSGNCAPVAQTFDTNALSAQVNRPYGAYIGTCGIGVTMIVPDGWRWVDLLNTPLTEAAQSLRPTQSEQMAGILEPLVALGGVLWADGPVVDDFLVNLNVVAIDADVSLTSTPDEVVAALGQRGVSTEGRRDRTLAGEPVLSQAFDQGGGSAVTYMIPDFGYVIAVTIAAPDATTATVTGDAIAATVLGC